MIVVSQYVESGSQLQGSGSERIEKVDNSKVMQLSNGIMSSDELTLCAVSKPLGGFGMGLRDDIKI